MLRRQRKFLGGDRAAVLTLQAAAKGVIDFSKTDLHSPSWWKSWRYLTEVLDSADYGDLLKLGYEFQLALISSPRLGPDDFTATQRRAKDLFYDLEGNARPWLGRTKEDRDLKERDQFRQQWIEHFGFDPHDGASRLDWEDQLSERLETSNRDREAAEAKDKEATVLFNRRVEEIRLKRLRQQGRI